MRSRNTFVAVISIALAVTDLSAQKNTAQPGAAPLNVRSYLNLPLAFERQQSVAEDRFVARGQGYAVGIDGGKATIGLVSDPGKTSQAISLEFAGARRAVAVPGPELPGKVNYIHGNDPRKWQIGLATWARVAYPEVYPGIDVIYYGNQQQLEFDLIVKPGADPGAIRMKIGGAKKLSFDGQGALKIDDLRLELPKIYQDIKGERRSISGHYTIASRGEVAFRVDRYDRTQPLVIDPTLVYSTFVGGGTNFGFAQAVARDSSGNILLAGYTYAQDFPTVNAAQGAYGGNGNGFVTKINPAGTALLYSTYIGGSGGDGLYSIAVDTSGSAWAAGYSYSTNFPLVNPVQATPGGNGDAVLLKLSSAGALLFSTYLGGPAYDQANGVAVDSSSNAYVTGYTSGAFPTTSGVVQTTNQGGNDIFVEKFNSSGSRIYSTLLGGTQDDSGNAVAADSGGNAYVTGSTYSATFIPAVPAGGAQTTYEGNGDAFVAKVNSTGTALTYFTFLGGSGNDIGYALGLDSLGNATIGGQTTSAGLATAGAAQTTPGGGEDGFIARLNQTATQFTFITYLGGNRSDYLSALALDGGGNTYVTGYTDSTNLATVAALQPAMPGNSVSLFQTANSAATWSAFDTNIPGRVFDIAPDPVTSGTIVVATVEGVFRTTNNGSSWTQEISGNFGALYLSRSPAAPSTIYLVQGNGTTHKSTDDGVTWTTLGVVAGGGSGIIADPLNASAAYVFDGSGVYATSNGGTTWTQVNNGLPSTQVVAMTAASDGSLYAALPQGIYKSTNQGASWTQVNTGLPPVYPQAYSLSASGTTVYFATGNIYKTTNGGASWTALSGSLSSAEEVIAAPQNASILYAGTYNNTVLASTDGGVTWTSPGTGLTSLPGSPFEIVIDPLNTAHVFFESIDNTVAFVGKLNSTGSSFTYLTYFGGAGVAGYSAEAFGIATDGAGNAFVAGVSEPPGFPITSNALQPVSGQITPFLSEISDSTSSCSYSVSPDAATINGGGQSLTVAIVAPSGCAWTASGLPSWATVTSASSGAGAGYLTLQFSSNTTGNTRVASLNVNGASVTITQPDSSCNYSVDKSNYPVAAGGGPISPVLTAGAACPWVVTNNYPFAVYVGVPSGTGNATLSVTVGPNDGPTARTFNLPVGTTQVQISQSGLLPAITSGPNYGVYSVGDVQIPLTASGGTPPYTWSVLSGTPPSGLYIRTDGPSWFPASASAGIIGSTAATGPASFTLQVTDSNSNSATQLVSFYVTSLTVLDPYQMTDAFTGVAYSATLTAGGATGAVSWAVASGSSLPASLTLTGATISGTPTTPGAYSFTMTATDTVGTVYRGYNVNVYGPGFSSSGALGNATIGTAITPIQLNGKGGTPPYTFNGGSAPGLSVSSSGLISGTPTGGPGTYRFNLTITDHAGLSYSKNFAIAYLEANGTPALLNMGYPNPSDAASVGQPHGFGFNANGGTQPYTWSVSGLPAGMFMRTSNLSTYLADTDAEINGTPLAPGAYPAVVSLTDSSTPPVTIRQPFFVNVVAMDNDYPNSFTRGTAASFYLRPIGGSAPFTWTISNGALPSGMTLNTATGIISGTPVENGSFSVEFGITSSARSGSLQLVRNIGFNVNSPTSPPISGNGTTPDVVLNSGYYYTLQFCCGAGSLTYAVTAGALPGGLTLNSATGVISGTATVAGVFPFTITAPDSANPANFGVRVYSITVSSIQVSTPTPPGNVGASYTENFTATGGTGTYTWTAGPGSQLPPGINLYSSGFLTGIPTSEGSFNLNYTVTDSAGHSYLGYANIQIYPAGVEQPITISNGPNLGTFTTGTFQLGLGATGGNGAYTWTLVSGSLPPGLALRTDTPSYFASNQQAGLIGVATTPGNYSFTLQVASGGAASLTQAFQMKITALTVMDINLPDGFANTAYSHTFTPVGNAGTVTFAPNGSLPAGLDLSTGGVLSGTPTAPGNYNINFSIFDGTDTIYRGFNLIVYAVHITTSGELTPNATQYMSYTQTLAASGGSGGYTFSLNGSSLPPGLTLSTAGVISGTVNGGPGLYIFNVKVVDSSNNSYQKTMSLDVVGEPVALNRITMGSIDDAVIGDGFGSQVPICCGGTGPFTWSARGLPAGMSIRSGSGVTSDYIGPGFAEIFGTPQAAGNFQVQVTVTDSTNASTTLDFPFHVSNLDVNPGGMANATLGVPYTNPFRVLGGGAPYNLAFIDGHLPAGLTVNSAAVEVVGTPSEDPAQFNAPGFRFGDSSTNTLRRTYGFSISSGSTANVTINNNDGYNGYLLGTTPTGVFYSTQFSACCVASYNWSFSSGTLPPGLTLSSGGVLSGTPTTAGTYTFIVKAADSTNASNAGLREYVLTVSPITITTSSLPYGDVGTAYNAPLSATGTTGSTTWTVIYDSILPPGLTLQTNGTITGTPTSAGSYYVTVQVQDANNNIAIRNWAINIYASGPPPVSINNGANLGTWPVGTDQIELDASGGNGAYTWTVPSGSTLPPGLALRTDLPSFFSPNASAGLIGVATTPGTYTFSLQVTSGGTTDVQPFTITISRLNVMDPNLQDAFVGTAYSHQFTPVGQASGSTVTFTPASSPFPSWLTLSSSGTLSGIPPSAGNYQVAFFMTDGTSTIYWQFGLNVYAVDITTAGALPNGTQGSSYGPVTITATGGVGGYTFTTGGLPPGLTLSSTGVISGTADYFGIYPFSITATDTSGNSYTKPFTIVVVGVPPALPRIEWYQADDLVVGDRQSLQIGVCCGGTAPFTWSASNLPPGLGIRQGTAASSYVPPAFAEIYGSPQVAGHYTFTVTLTDAANNTTSNTFSINVGIIDVTPGLPAATYGAPYTGTLRVIGGTGPYSAQFVDGELPGRLSLIQSPLEITGTPTEDYNCCNAPVFLFSDNAGNTLRRTEYIQLNPPSGSNIVINNSGYESYNLGAVPVNSTGYRNQLTACCVPSYVWAVVSGVLPPGMTLSTGGLLSGTPTTVGTYTFLVSASNASNSSDIGYRQFVLTVSSLSINGNPPYGTMGTAYSYTFGTNGASGAVTWSVTFDTALPPGLSLNPSTGVLNGSPASAGSYYFTLLARDAGGNIAISGFNINIYRAGGSPPLQLVTVAPCRIMDTRNPDGPFGGPYVAGGTTRTIPIPSSSCNVPANAVAYSLNITVIPRKGTLGYLSVWPTGQSQPLVSTLNSLDGSILANAAIVPAGAAGAIDAFATNDTDLIVDINGYFVPPAANTLQFYALPPCRVLDTRNPNGVFGGPSIAGGGNRSFPIPSSSCGAPANAAAYSLNVTVVPQGELGYLTAWPTGQTQPVVSTLNSLDATILANAAIVPAGTGGAVSFFASNTTDVIVDINGYFAPPATGGLNFYTATPCRLVDTRNANGPLGGPVMSGGTTRTFPLTQGSCGLSDSAQAYSLNMTVVPQAAILGYLSTWPAGGTQPVVSTLNALKGQVVANAAIVPAGASGSIDVYVTNNTHVIIDTNGYFGQ